MARHARGGRREEPRGAWQLVLALWIAFIWVHSLIPGPASSDESMLLVSIVRPLFGIVGVTDVDAMQFVVRKVAHFSEYFALGLLCVAALQPRWEVPFWPAVLTVVLWWAVPLVDELVIQARVPGRDGSMRDVLIDVAGFAVGLTAAILVRRVVEARRRVREEQERLERERRAARYYARAQRRTRRARREWEERYGGGSGRHRR